VQAAVETVKVCDGASPSRFILGRNGKRTPQVPSVDSL